LFGRSLCHGRGLQPITLGEQRVSYLGSVDQYSGRQESLVEVDVSNRSGKRVELAQFRSPLSEPGGLREGGLVREAGSGEHGQPPDAGDCSESPCGVALAQHHRAPKCHQPRTQSGTDCVGYHIAQAGIAAGNQPKLGQLDRYAA
jgi:hypothetical protein